MRISNDERPRHLDARPAMGPRSRYAAAATKTQHSGQRRLYPIADRACPQDSKTPKKSLTPNRPSVTYVLDQMCYLCPDPTISGRDHSSPTSAPSSPVNLHSDPPSELIDLPALPHFSFAVTETNENHLPPLLPSTSNPSDLPNILSPLRTTSPSRSVVKLLTSCPSPPNLS